MTIFSEKKKDKNVGDEEKEEIQPHRDRNYLSARNILSGMTQDEIYRMAEDFFVINDDVSDTEDMQERHDLPVARIVSSRNVILMEDETGDSSANDFYERSSSIYVGQVISGIQLDDSVCRKVTWLTYKRLLMISFCVISSLVALVPILYHTKPSEISPTPSPTNAPTLSPSAMPTSYLWPQVGDNITGDSEKRMGLSVSISRNGKRIFVGAEDSLGTFDYYAGQWIPVDDLFTFFSPGSITSLSISSDGSFLIAGQPTIKNNVGAATVLQQNNSDIWVKRGQTLEGEGEDRFGSSVGIADNGNIISVGTTADYVSICTWMNDVWTVRKIEREAGMRFGLSLSMASDGSKIIIGAQKADYNGRWSGAAFIYSLGANPLLKQVLYGDNRSDFFGQHVAMSAEGTKAAVGTANYLKIYKISPDEEYFVLSIFMKIVEQDRRSLDESGNFNSEDIKREYEIEIEPVFYGRPIVFSADGTRLAIGDPSNSRTSVYEIKNKTRTLIGEVEGGEGGGAGASMAFSGNGKRVVIGAPLSNGEKGQVRVFDTIGTT